MSQPVSKRKDPARRSSWGADLEPTKSQTQYLDFLSRDTNVDIELPMEMGEYAVHRVLGRGGMGVVFEGEHRRMQRRVAIKVLAGPQADATHAQEQFLSEIRAVARLLHPRIVTAFDAGQFGSMVYLVMEYVDGLTLVSLLLQQGPQSVDRALHLILQAAEGLEHAHLNGVIHRDVKPGNLMVTSDGAVKVLDLGLAAFASGVLDDSQSNAQRRICGTPEYMAPEQFENSDLTEAVDIYALGCTLFTLLTAKPPYEGNAVAQLRAHCTKPFPRLRDHGVENRAELQSLLDRMTAKDADARFASMDQVITAIRAIEVKDEVAFTGSSPIAHRSGFLSDADIGTGEETIGMAQRATVGVDLGADYLGVALGNQAEAPRVLNIGNQAFDLLPSIVAPSRSRVAVFGAEAVNRLRGTDQTDRAADYLKTGNRFPWCDGLDYPPCTPLAMLLGHVKNIADSASVTDSAGDQSLRSVNLAITVPSSFTQVMRERLAAAMGLAQFDAVKMIDRNLAACLTQFNFGNYSAKPKLDATPGPWLIVSISDLSMEVSLLTVAARRVQMLSVAGDMESNERRWHRRLRKGIEQKITQLEARESAVSHIDKTELRQRVFRAVHELAKQNEVEVAFRMGKRNVRFSIGANTILQCCGDLIEQLGEMLAVTLSEAGVDGDEVVACMAVGPWASVLPVQNLLRNFGIAAPPISISQSQLAIAAANLGLLTRLPVRDRPHLIPCNAHDMGIAIGEDSSMKSAQMLIPRLTSLPAYANRQWSDLSGKSKAVTLVESTSLIDTRWVPFGKIEIPSNPGDVCEGAFEIDDQGILRSQVINPGSHRHDLAAISNDDLQRTSALVGRAWQAKLGPQK